LYDKDNSLLFDRRRDPLETSNLFYKDSSRATVSSLRKVIEQQVARTSDRFAVT
jgi:hypothetical protein